MGKPSEKALKNLKPIQKGQLSREELIQRASNGAKKREENKLKKAIFKEEIEKQLATTIDKIVEAQVMKAIKKQDTKAAEFLADYAGQAPVVKQQIQVSSDSIKTVEELYKEL